MTETWKHIQGWPDYKVSSLGRIKSRMAHGGFGAYPTPWRIIKGFIKDGYKKVVLRRLGFSKKMPVHKLMLLTFKGPPPEGKPFALHKDDIKLNNSLENLYWGSKSDNMKDAYRNGRKMGIAYVSSITLSIAQRKRRTREAKEKGRL